MHRKKKKGKKRMRPTVKDVWKRGGRMEWKREKKENADLKYTPLSFI